MGTQKSATIEEMKTTLIVLGLAAYSQAKFCPGEKNGNKCVAGDNSYKCAVFFENLTSKRPLTWIGALPDALKKAKNKEEAEDILGTEVTEESFSQLDSCDAKTANARCYSILDDQKNIKLDLRQKLDQHRRFNHRRRLSLWAGQKMAEKQRQ